MIAPPLGPTGRDRAQFQMIAMAGVALAIVVFSVIATQVTAAHFGDDPTLGPQWGAGLYPPFQWLVWSFRFYNAGAVFFGWPTLQAIGPPRHFGKDRYPPRPPRGAPTLAPKGGPFHAGRGHCSRGIAVDGAGARPRPPSEGQTNAASRIRRSMNPAKTDPGRMGAATGAGCTGAAIAAAASGSASGCSVGSATL